MFLLIKNSIYWKISVLSIPQIQYLTNIILIIILVVVVLATTKNEGIMDEIEQLQRLGFGQYEAKAYLALLRKNPLSGYELAKASGIPRPNIYAVLQKLEESGAVMRLAIPEGTRYAPVAADELLAKLKRQYHQSLEAASTSLQKIAAPSNIEAVLNFRGYAELLEQARALLDRAEHHLLISLWPEEAQVLSEMLNRASERGVQMTTLCLRGCPQPCPACRGSIFRYALAPEKDARWLVLVADESELLAGEILPADGTSTAVRTRQQMLVNLTGSYIQNSIALAAVLTSFGNRLYSELDPQTLTALNALHPLHAQGEWLKVMQHMLDVGKKEPQN
jgi:HTH-type transcriptional regulator, sugar sensing transcriptional regulator